jgi:integral membrane protein (TIGR00529 family)
MMALNILMGAPVLVKLLITLGVILVVNGRWRQLLPAVATGTLVLAVWCGFSPARMAEIATGRFFSADNLALMLLTVLVVWLSLQMSETGSMKDLVQAVRERLPQRVALAALPALIGMLPMPGGAIFSAPLVDQCDTEQVLPPLLKTKINYWFRHVWEYWWPLYPGVLLAMDLTRFEVWQFMLLQLPLSLLAMAVGYVFLLRRVPRAVQSATAPSASRVPLLPLLSPIWMVIVVYALVRILLPFCYHLNKYAPMLLGLLASMLWLQFRHPLGLASWKRIMLSRKTLVMAAIIAMVRIYGAFIEAELPGGGLLVEQVRQELTQWGIPVWAMIMLIPFVSGLSTGLAIGFVGASFPIVMSLVGPAEPLTIRLATCLLAYASGYVGMTLSPVHICLIVTNEHFHTRLGHSLGRLLPLTACVMLGAIGFYRLILCFAP